MLLFEAYGTVKFNTCIQHRLGLQPLGKGARALYLVLSIPISRVVTPKRNSRLWRGWTGISQVKPEEDPRALQVEQESLTSQLIGMTFSIHWQYVAIWFHGKTCYSDYLISALKRVEGNWMILSYACCISIHFSSFISSMCVCREILIDRKWMGFREVLSSRKPNSLWVIDKPDVRK